MRPVSTTGPRRLCWGVPAYDDDLALALALADDADVVTLARYQSQDLIVETKPDLTPVSDADRAAEELLRARLAVERPADGVHGEELGVTGSGARQWILDPIDGTKNFVRGVPVWATLVALADGDRVVVGVVSAPALGRRWWAARGSGAWVGGALETTRQIGVSQVRTLADASLSYSDQVGWDGGPDRFRGLAHRVWRTRAYGDFWSHLLVAEGAVDVAVEPDLQPWDIAALVPIVEEAGGRITGTDGRPVMDGGGGALTTNGRLTRRCWSG